MSDFNPMTPYDQILTFDVYRKEDATGTSGTGVVAMGVIFPDGTTVVQWQTHVRSTVFYGSMADALYIHGHGDSTGFRFHNCPDRIYLSDGTFVVLASHDSINLTNDNKLKEEKMCSCGTPEYSHTVFFHA